MLKYFANLYFIKIQMKELYIQLNGRVQGVNLRRRTVGLARKLHLKGYVKNLKDGSVEILAQGKEKDLEELLNWLQKGYFPIKLTGMNIEWHEEPTKKYKNFNIKKRGWFLVDEAKSLIHLGRGFLNLDHKELNIPNHLVIIPDGSRRWARENGLKAWVGHQKAASQYENIKEILTTLMQLGTKYLSFWGFSTENWDRDEKEVDVIFQVFRDSIQVWKEDFMKQGIRFRHLGRKDRIPLDVLASINSIEEETKENKNFNFQLCLDYGGRDDLVRAINLMIADGVKEVSEAMISGYLDSKDIPDPDLIIRTSGEQRTSGFMTYQCAYSELYFTSVYFPEFDSDQLKRAILDYSGRTRRFGGTAEKDLERVNVAGLKG